MDIDGNTFTALHRKYASVQRTLEMRYHEDVNWLLLLLLLLVSLSSLSSLSSSLLLYVTVADVYDVFIHSLNVH